MPRFCWKLRQLVSVQALHPLGNQLPEVLSGQEEERKDAWQGKQSKTALLYHIAKCTNTVSRKLQLLIEGQEQKSIETTAIISKHSEFNADYIIAL